MLQDGEKLIGTVKNATGASVMFSSNSAGNVTVAWSRVQSLESQREFAVVETGMRITKRSDVQRVPQGTIRVEGSEVEVTPAAPGGAMAEIPLSKVAEILPEAEFEASFHKGRLLGGWKGGATGGVSLVEATQNDEAYTATLNLTKTVSNFGGLGTHSRSIVNFNEAYGQLTQPGEPTVKTSLFDLLGEHDWYRSARVFEFATLTLEHSYSQGLDLQQSYGGGLGWVAVKTANQELDVKAGVDYINQRFTASALNTQLVGSTFGETYQRSLVHGIGFNEQLGVTPAWNDMRAVSAVASAALTFPVYHHLGFTISALDNFLNNPPPEFKKNSFEFSAGATYSFG